MQPSSRPKPNPITARLRLKGYSLTAFAAERGYSLRTVKAAVRGEKNGPKSKAILADIRSISSKKYAA